jgi:hypothetical protein
VFNAVYLRALIERWTGSWRGEGPPTAGWHLVWPGVYVPLSAGIVPACICRPAKASRAARSASFYSASPSWSEHAPERPPEWLYSPSLQRTTAPLPFGKFGMHVFSPQNFSSSAWQVDPGPSTSPPQAWPSSSSGGGDSPSGSSSSSGAGEDSGAGLGAGADSVSVGVVCSSVCVAEDDASSAAVAQPDSASAATIAANAPQALKPPPSLTGSSIRSFDGERHGPHPPHKPCERSTRKLCPS